MMPPIKTTGGLYSSFYNSLKSLYGKTSVEAKNGYNTIATAKKQLELGPLVKVYYYPGFVRLWFDAGIITFNTEYNGLHSFYFPSVIKPDSNNKWLPSLHDNIKWWAAPVQNRYYFVHNVLVPYSEVLKFLPTEQLNNLRQGIERNIGSDK